MSKPVKNKICLYFFCDPAAVVDIFYLVGRKEIMPFKLPILDPLELMTVMVAVI